MLLFQKVQYQTTSLPPNKKRTCEWLCWFATEIRKNTDHRIIAKQATISWASRGISNRAPINFLTNAEFLQLRNLLDSLYGKLHASGVGTSTKRMPALTADDEDKLLTSKVLNPEMPQGLLNCVFFLNGKTFCLRGGAKHWDLKLSQLVRKLSALMEYPLCNIHTQSTSLRITMVD